MLIKNGLLALPGKKDFVKYDIREEKGKIVEIGKNLKGKDVIDVKGFLVFPGGIDAHVHFNEPGFEEREEFSTGSKAAISSGITTVIDMPCTSIPPVTNLKNFMYKYEKIKGKSYVDFGFFGGVSGDCEDIENSMKELSRYVLGFKVYFLSGMDTFKEINHFQFENILKIAKKLKKTVLLHAEDPLFVRSATEYYKKKGNSPMNYYYSRPEIAEIIAVQNACKINEKINAELHIVHISTAESVDIISRYASITCETAPHYLEFSFDDLKKYGNVLKTAPVVKSEENRKKLNEFFINGKISYIASDHAPSPEYQKRDKTIWESYSGIPGIETIYLYTLSEFLFKNRISLKRFFEVTSENPARRFNIFGKKGSIEIGKDCDLVIVNPDEYTVIKGEKFFSKGKLTPFEERKFKGKIIMTILRGKIAFESPDKFYEAKGKFLNL